MCFCSLFVCPFAFLFSKWFFVIWELLEESLDPCGGCQAKTSVQALTVVSMTTTTTTTFYFGFKRTKFQTLLPAVSVANRGGLSEIRTKINIALGNVTERKTYYLDFVI